MALRVLLLATLLAAAGFSGAAAQRGFQVPADHAGLIRLPGDAAAVVVGNPGIADAALYDARTVFVTGKVFGRTNLIALSASGQVLYTADLSVTRTGRGMLRVYRNTDRFSYACDPDCEALPMIGDEHGWFRSINEQRGLTRGGAEDTEG